MNPLEPTVTAIRVNPGDTFSIHLLDGDPRVHLYFSGETVEKILNLENGESLDAEDVTTIFDGSYTFLTGPVIWKLGPELTASLKELLRWH